ncbi:MAG: hypothetical protein U1F27_09255 [Turneriella sp.]
MKKISMILVAVAFTATGIAAKVNPAEVECRKKANEAHKHSVDAQKQAQAECKKKPQGADRNQCYANVVKAVKEATATRDAAYKTCKSLPAAPAAPKY